MNSLPFPDETKEPAEAEKDKHHRHSTIAQTPKPPYYAVIFTSLRATDEDEVASQEDDSTADRMVELAAQSEGFLGVESVRDGLGITISYWTDLTAIKKWKNHSKHLVAQEKGKRQWYSAYTTRIARVDRDYCLEHQERAGNDV